ncbi:hypothetical protein J6590_058270 [Homalodisca vitripennis]|nr:hypothetical protein J6590_058270 [Homalodisca vitripennis]
MRDGPTAHTKTEMPVRYSIRTEPSASMPLSGFLTAFPIYDAYNADSWLEDSDHKCELCLSPNCEIDGPSDHYGHNTGTELSSTKTFFQELIVIDDPSRPLPSHGTGSAPPQLQSHQIANANLFYVGKDSFCKWLIHKPFEARQ